MLSDYAAFAASPYTTHAGAFHPSTARRPTAGWLAMRDAYRPCTEQTSPPFMRAFPTAPPLARSRAVGTTRPDRIAPTACGKSPRATGVCSPSLRWRSRSPRPIGNSQGSASLLTCCSVALSCLAATRRWDSRRSSPRARAIVSSVQWHTRRPAAKTRTFVLRWRTPIVRSRWMFDRTTRLKLLSAYYLGMPFSIIASIVAAGLRRGATVCVMAKSRA